MNPSMNLNMNLGTHTQNRHVIVYDADRIPEPQLRLMDPAYWEGKGAVSGQAAGRGNTLLLETPFGPAVLRRYLRGGWPARISRDRYLYSGLHRSRPIREFNILRQLAEKGLPCPVPLAASCDRGLISYRGALLMEEIRDVAPLVDFLGSAQSGAALWADVGACIHAFHQAGVHHADLNARNLLVNRSTGEVFLVDFDRCTLNPGIVVDGKSNLARLKRSLSKLWPWNDPDTLQACWQALLDGYHD